MRRWVAGMAGLMALGCIADPLPGLITARTESPDATADAGRRPPDGGTGGDGGAPADAGLRPDGGVCPGADVWRRESRPIVAVALFSEVPRNRGITERLRVSVQLTAECDHLPAVQVSATPGNATDFVRLTATAFTRDRNCPAQSRLHTLVVDVPGTRQGNFSVRVEFDEGSFLYQRQDCTGTACLCTDASPRGTAENGASCSSDCDCVAGMACLARSVPGARCATPCQDVLDCLPLGRACVEDTGRNPPMTCFGTETECLNGNCPDGFECAPGSTGILACQDRRTALGQPCQCLGDCEPGESCSADPGRAPTCHRLCNRDVDCPWGLFICAPDGVCRPLE